MLSARSVATACSWVLSAAAFCQNSVPPDPLKTEGYILPPHEVADAALAPWYKNVSITNLSPDHKHFVQLVRDGMPSLAAMGKDHVNLGGFQVDTVANRARELTTRSAAGIRIVELGTGKGIDVEIPKGARVSDAVWSRDGSKVAFIADFVNKTELWVANAVDGKSRAATDWPVLATMVTTLTWTADGKIVTVLVPKGRAPLPVKPAIATTPKVKVTDGKVTSVRTYPSLLQNPYEAQLVEYYATGQLAVVDPVGSGVKTIGKPSMIRSVNPAPDAKNFIVTLVQKPFSYIFPVSNFGQREVIWDEMGTQKSLISTSRTSNRRRWRRSGWRTWRRSSKCQKASGMET